MKRHHVLLLALLGSAALLSCAQKSPTAAPSSTAVSKAATTTCQLEVEGYGSAGRPDIKTAKLSCSDGTITAAAAPMLRKALGPKGTQGVSWSTSPACMEYVNDVKCIFVVCSDTPVTFVKPVLKDIQLPADQLIFGLCMVGGSEAVIRGGLFTGLSMRSVVVDGEGTSLLIADSTFEGGEGVGPKSPPAGGVGALGGRTVITSSRFAGNIAANGAAIWASGQAKVDVDPDHKEKSGGLCGRRSLSGHTACTSTACLTAVLQQTVWDWACWLFAKQCSSC